MDRKQFYGEFDDVDDIDEYDSFDEIEARLAERHKMQEAEKSERADKEIKLSGKAGKSGNIAKTVGKIIGRVLLCVVTFLIVVVLTLLSAIAVICKGPSVIVRDMFVMAMTETGQMDFLAYIFLSDEEVAEILASHEIIVPEGETDVSLIQVGEKADDDSSSEEEFDINGFEIIDIKGKTYKGKLMVVNDPSRVTVGTAAAYGD
ncbi:MAG: hypothetical protein IJZ90_00920, partial [Clostridia bacterium]|nr:hypothetical protein [Clostridia bacterium]